MLAEQVLSIKDILNEPFSCRKNVELKFRVQDKIGFISCQLR